jgi:hypothetical protein
MWSLLLFSRTWTSEAELVRCCQIKGDWSKMSQNEGAVILVVVEVQPQENCTKKYFFEQNVSK